MTKTTSPSLLHSMTGFATGSGQYEGWQWSTEIRAVNGKGLDLRMRVPDWIDGLEPAMRASLGKAAARGNVMASVRVSRDATSAGIVLNAGALDQVLNALRDIEARAQTEGVDLAPTNAADIAQIRGVLDQGSDSEADTGPLRAAILVHLDEILTAFNAMRQTEGAALGAILSDQLDETARLVAKAQAQIAARQDQMAETLRQNLTRVLETVGSVDEARLAQELAVIVVKSDVTEELDRLTTHITAARDLLAAGGPAGRKLDFLMQEFNREANTLCSKSQNSDLTQTGLALKTVIDQMREQVQNLE